jgi:hypothetical protein
MGLWFVEKVANPSSETRESGSSSTMARWIIGTIVVIVVASVGIVTAREKPENLPKEVRHAEETLTKWLKGFDGQTPEEIRKSLGKPDGETDWLFEGEKQPLYQYQVSAATELSIYFSEGRAVKLGLHLLP